MLLLLLLINADFCPELYHEAELDLANAEGAATNAQRLSVLREQEDLIEEEEEQAKSSEGGNVVKDDENIDDENKDESKDEKDKKA